MCYTHNLIELMSLFLKRNHTEYESQNDQSVLCEGRCGDDSSISVVCFRVSQVYLRDHRVKVTLLGLIVTCLQLAQVCTFLAVAHALTFWELASMAALAQQQM